MKIEKLLSEEYKKRMKTVSDGKETTQELAHDSMFLDHFKDVVLVDTALSTDKNSKNALLNISEPSSRLKSVITNKLSKIMPTVTVLWDKKNKGEIPLFDLVLKKLEPKIFKVSKSTVIPMRTFMPMMPKHQFFEVNELLDYLYGG